MYSSYIMSLSTKQLIRKKFFESVVIFLFGAGLQVIVFCQACWSDWRVALIIGTYSGFLWVLLAQGSEYLVQLLNRWVDWLKFPIRRLIVSLLAVCALVLMVTSVMNAVYSYVVSQLTSFNYSFADFNGVLVITLGVNAIMHGRSFLLNWKKAAIDIERMKTEQLSSQFESLKNQVNPHFLFNSLNALSSLVYDDQRKAVEFIRKLSEVYRYVLDQKDEEVVSVSDEMAFVASYIFLHQIRFGDNLQVVYHGEMSKGHVPPLAVQMLIENAIKHNVVSESKPLTIDVTYRPYEIEVSNQIQRKASSSSTGVGLRNLKARYKYLSALPVEIKDDEGVFSVTLPLLDLK